MDLPAEGWDEFEQEYTDLVHDVITAGYQTYELKLHDFMQLITRSDNARRRIADLAKRFDFNAWYAECETGVSGIDEASELKWSRDRGERLAQQLSLFKHLAEKENAYMSLCHSFLYAGSRFDDMIDKINTELFEPFARELLKDLRRHAPFETKSADAPASDRIVQIDHNSAAFEELSTTLEQLVHRVNVSNELSASEPEERDRILAELSAGQRLLQSVRVRTQPILGLLTSAFAWIAAKIADKTVEMLVTAGLIALAAILGITIPGL